ncbi:hypothetical protein IMCC20628_01612 [Hoeflea sp. IMCC20628]|uniref:hypothetical protein n=1 Tax=Hoeflea sp. IMCC20628 TaxID=1620421 RepID=UPI00063AA3AB|nr:hypothetical protein [Hoeflea sp. IMCC20628]AKI00328.1 hypothetical protein IMCC20628_01612 [Hoeflea sp. IMCC20628]
MHKYPPVFEQDRHDRREHGYEPQETNTTGISLWIAAVVVIVSLAALLLFSDGKLSNGGAPFVITPPSQVTASPAMGL